MKLKNISVSESNYEKLRNFGHAGESFNDVISELLAIVITTGPQFDDVKQQRSERRPGNHTQTVPSPNNPE